MSSNPYDRETVGAYPENKFHRTFGIHKMESGRLLGIVESWMEKKDACVHLPCGADHRRGAANPL